MPTNPIMLMLLFIYIFLTNLFPCPRYRRCLGTEEMKYRMLQYFALFCYNPKYGHHCDKNMSYFATNDCRSTDDGSGDKLMNLPSFLEAFSSIISQLSQV